MRPEDTELMAYADGELDPLAAKHVERAIAADPALAQAVEAHRALRRRLDAAFAPVLSDAMPDRLAAMLRSNVVPLAPRPVPRRWWTGMAVAASLVLGIGLGTQWSGSSGPVTAGAGGLVASGGSGLVAAGDLARRLDTQLASARGDTRMLVSFRDVGGRYCRVFASPALDGLACNGDGGWQLLRTQTAAGGAAGAYRQAGSGDAALMAAAQDMMRGDPLDAAAEARARDAGWR